MGRLENKVALITGGASGIGKAIALAFAQERADVCIADKNFTGAQATAREVEKIGRKSLAIQIDVLKISELERMVSAAVDYFGKIDIMVNDAGVNLFKSVLEVTEAEWGNVIDVNLKGLFFATQRVLPVMLKQGRGKIVNIASNWGAVGYRNACVYCVSKAGIINLTRAMALELAPHKINVNAIGPACTETPMSKPELDDAELRQSIVREIPLGRVAQPEEIAAAAVYLASDESDFVTGHTLFVDGGFLAQ
jgi:2-deoxy-D-gluconate 3-dehydrogenase